MISNLKNQKIILNKNLPILKENNDLKIIFYIEKINKKKKNEIFQNLYTRKIRNTKENKNRNSKSKNFSNEKKKKKLYNAKKLITNRCTNPLNPKYNFPKLKKKIFEIPKFLKDPLEINDIKGTRSIYKIRELNNSLKKKIFLRKKKTFFNKQDYILKKDDLKKKKKKNY